MTYKHAEAFCLMIYRADDGSEQEVIWNSRDGVTPMVITLRSGKQATHVNWMPPWRVPDYKPPLGSRIFVDLTAARARELAEARVDAWIADPETRDELIQVYGSREEAVARQAEISPGWPDLITVAG